MDIKGNLKVLIIVLTVFLAVGYSATTIALYINSRASLVYDADDFSIYFSKVFQDDSDITDTSIGVSGTSFEFTSFLNDNKCKLVSGDLITPGSEVCCNDQCFYIVSNDVDSVKMLSKYNLAVGYSCTSTTSCSLIENPTGIQDTKTVELNSSRYSAWGTTPFSITGHMGATESTYEGSLIQSYVDNYADYLASNSNLTIEEATLITKEELEALGCQSSIDSCSVSNKPWIYETFYWTRSEKYRGVLYRVEASGSFHDGTPYNSVYISGVRPLITIPASEISSEINLSDSLKYVVENSSTQYDVQVNVVCTPSVTDGVSIEIIQIDNVIPAQSSANGEVKVTLDGLYSSTESFVCRLEVEAIERTETASKPLCPYENGSVWEFAFSGAMEEFQVPCSGTYKVELWGAQGGNTTLSRYSSIGGKGAYTSGDIYLRNATSLYVYVGGKGEDGKNNRLETLVAGGYNGGGSNGSRDAASSAGGGATDIRLVPGEWNDFDSLKSRIMVAGAGGGAGIKTVGASGGSLQTLFGKLYGYNGTQTSGGGAGTGYTYDSYATSGGFGYGGNSGYYVTGAGGSGYYGGGGGNHISPSTSGGGGSGSSYISGHPGCVAIGVTSTEDNIIHANDSLHYSGYMFFNTTAIAGDSSMPTYDAMSTMIGNSGDGYAKITLVDSH